MKTCRNVDGEQGESPEPFDRINVTAVAPSVPSRLQAQLADPGRMVIPLGPREGSHELTLLTKRDGAVERSQHGPVRFVPLIGAHGFDG